VNLFDMFDDVTGGNPGAMIALGNICLAASDIDPKAYGKRLMPVIDCQYRDIRGETLWDLWKYLIKEEVKDFFILARSVQFGLITIETLKEKIHLSRREDTSKWMEAVRTIWLDRSPNLLNLDYEHKLNRDLSVAGEAIIAISDEISILEKEHEALKLKQAEELEEKTKGFFVEPRITDSETPEVNPSIVGVYAFHQTNLTPVLSLEIRPNDNGPWVIGFSASKVRKRFTNDVDDCIDSTYNEMYLHISGSKEYSFSMNHSDITHHWGVFHKQGQVQGWFYHTSDIEKKQGKFYIVVR